MLKPLNNLGHAGAATTYTRLDSPFVRRANLIFVCERAKQPEAARLLNKTLLPGEFQLIWLDALVPEMARRLRKAGISENVSSHALRREMKQFQQTFDFDTNEALLVTKSAIENFATEREPKPALYARAYGLLARVFQQLTTNHGIALLVNQSTDFPAGLHRIHLCGQNARARCCERSDWRVPLRPESGFATQIALAMESAEQSHRRRTDIRKKLLAKKIKLVPKPVLKHWPKDPLMKWAHAQIVDYLQDWKLPKHADKTDLKHQVAFRLTTIPVEDAATDGALLKDYLVSTEVYSSWSNIPHLSADIITRHRLKPEILKYVVEEQTALIERRLHSTGAPLSEITVQYRELTKGTWYIQKVGGELKAVERDGACLPLEFKPVSLELARAIHSTLHYIHSPRADWAFGLFSKGADLPFSIISAALVDREYKKNALIFQGYPAHNAIESTRLYTFGFAPRYTSSAILKLLTKEIRKISPDTPVMLSAFMASHATGLSMVSGGFRDPVLAKPLNHRFLERDGLYEHTVQRRLEGATPGLESCWPLLPAFELMCPMDPPHYKPMSGSADYLIDMT